MSTNTNIATKANVNQTEKCFICKEGNLLTENGYQICYHCERLFPKSMNDVKKEMMDMVDLREEKREYLRTLDEKQNSDSKTLTSQEKEEISLWTRFHSLYVDLDFYMSKTWSGDFYDKKISHTLYLCHEICEKIKEYYK